MTERTPGLSTVTAFDAATGQVLGQTPVGSIPIGITQPHGTDKVYSSDEGADQLSVIAKDTIAVLTTIPMSAGSRERSDMCALASDQGRRSARQATIHRVARVRLDPDGNREPEHRHDPSIPLVVVPSAGIEHA